MARIKGGMNARRKHNRVLKLAKGYRGASPLCVRLQALMLAEKRESVSSDSFGLHVSMRQQE